jgi:asparagine synthase (glutamine-hydrolysing)
MEACFGERIDLEDVYSEAIEQWESCRSGALVDRTLQFYTKLYLQDDILTKVDRASMMHSLEVRAPFLDIDVVDFARRIPWRYKLRGGQTKYLLKKALEPLLPNDILYRSKKGFGVPIGSWFKSGAVALPEANIPGLAANCVSDRLAAHRKGTSDERAFLWGALTMTSFLGKDRRGRPVI